MKTAFTMIELVFIIVVLGILAAVAFPKLGPAVQDAQIAAGRSAISSIRSAIASERQRTMLRGQNQYPQILDDASTAVGQQLFDGNATVQLLQYPIISKTGGGGWMKTAAGYTFNAGGVTVTFTYNTNTGIFTCTRDNSAAGEKCKELID